ncbi:MAG: hypothetical protein Kow0042_01920 [Calditrichia bacterium]
MKTCKISYLFALFLVLSFVNFGCQTQKAPETPVKDGVLVHISHGPEDPHRLLMGLQMALMMAQTHDVLVYFDIKAVEAVLKDAPDVSFSHFPSSRILLINLIDTGVTLYVCPGCLKAAGKTAADLMDGLKIAEKEEFFNFTKGRILTLDY